jgi:hypothetical protein
VLLCQKKTIENKKRSKKNNKFNPLKFLKRSSTKDVSSSCAGATIQAKINLQPPNALPASFYWILIIPLCGFLGAYLARHPKMRSFMVNLMLAYRSVSSSPPLDWKELVSQTVSKVTGKDPPKDDEAASEKQEEPIIASPEGAKHKERDH